MCEITNKPTGILLISGGTRSLSGQRQTQNFVADLKRRMGRRVPVLVAHLEAQEPSLKSVLGFVDESGVQDWLCVPLYLFATGYTVLHNPVWIAKFLLLRRPYLHLRWMPVWGTERQLISLTAGYIHRLLLDFDETTTSVVLVGGASSSSKTFQRYRQVAKRISKWIGIPVKPSILAGVGTSAYDFFSKNSMAPSSRIFVPYIAFDGLLMEKFRNEIAKVKPVKGQQSLVALPVFAQTELTSFIYNRITSRFYNSSYAPPHNVEDNSALVHVKRNSVV
ncbi:sirohydrochlorin chelatase [Alicyclobacillus sp. SO9]|uniref:sirohydrochlorin chelatase n=1 Tax=Alicyclobacillus sp. SO9 TaxID=2665646 RepID=UPI0018E804E5|nr:CbiX/SirB N-terminal domain-containing protein [Alicyclobacillus sp. SO9]QQE77710.1 hypothetical protein GI364_17485 [Alicyclobacillus sp. SO9]